MLQLQHYYIIYLLTLFFESPILTISLIRIKQTNLKFKLNNLNIIGLNNVSLIKSFHYSCILQTWGDSNLTNGKKTSINQETQDTNIALKELENLNRENSQRSSFDKALPNISHLPKNCKVKSLKLQPNQTAVFKEQKGEKNLSFMFLLILIIIAIILFIFLRNNLLFVINYILSINFFWFKLIPTIIGCGLILFHLLSVIVLLKFSFVPDNEIINPQLIPNKIRNYLLVLKKFSKGEATNHYLYISIVNVVFTLISLIIFLITMNIFPLIWVK